MFDERQTYIVYDGDCPFCAQYVKLARLREAIGPVNLVSARTAHPVVDYVKSRGIDLNQEMALVMNGEIFAGADCMHRLALMSSNSGLANALMARLFASRRFTRFIYPALRTGRNATLRVLGRKPPCQADCPKRFCGRTSAHPLDLSRRCPMFKAAPTKSREAFLPPPRICWYGLIQALNATPQRRPTVSEVTE